jgi:hypothetical protein
MKAKKNTFRDIYSIDLDKNAFIIEIALDRYIDVFNEWDPAPFKKRDIDPDLHVFLDECSSDIPLKYPLILSFQLPKETADSQKENVIREGFKTFFSFNNVLIRKNIKLSNKRGALYAVTAFAFLFLALFSETKLVKNLLIIFLQEGLFIGGWVFLWEAFNCVFFQNKNYYAQLKEYERFMDAEIRFTYK